MSSLEAFIAKPPLQNYKNNIANTITMGEKREENQKRQKEKRAAGRNSGSRSMNSCKQEANFPGNGAI